MYVFSGKKKKKSSPSKLVGLSFSCYLELPLFQQPSGPVWWDSKQNGVYNELSLLSLPPSLSYRTLSNHQVPPLIAYLCSYACPSSVDTDKAPRLGKVLQTWKLLCWPKAKFVQREKLNLRNLMAFWRVDSRVAISAIRACDHVCFYKYPTPSPFVRRTLLSVYESCAELWAPIW